MSRNRSIFLILYKLFGFIVVSLFLLWPFFEGNVAWGVDYCIHPNGSQGWPNCVAGAGPTCAGAGSSCTLTAANANLTAGNRAIVMGGDYLDEKMDPANSGTSNTNRVTFKAYGDAEQASHDLRRRWAVGVHASRASTAWDGLAVWGVLAA